MILDELNKNGKLNVHTNIPLCIYTKDSVSCSACWDNRKNDELDIDNIDDSYKLEIEELSDRINVYIPKGARCVLKKTAPNVDCTVCYEYIECDLVFEESEDPIDYYFTIID